MSPISVITTFVRRLIVGSAYYGSLHKKTYPKLFRYNWIDKFGSFVASQLQITLVIITDNPHIVFKPSCTLLTIFVGVYWISHLEITLLEQKELGRQRDIKSKYFYTDKK